MSEEQFKSLIFVCGLKAEADAEIRTRLLTRIEEKEDVTLEQLSSECQRIVNLRHDTAMIEGSAVNAVRKQNQFRKRQQYNREHTPKPHAPTSEEKREPPTPCWNCGMMHYVRDCKLKNHRCSECSKYGHKEGYCASSRKHSRRHFRRKSNNITVSTNTVSVSVNKVHHRRKFVPVKLNSVPVRLQFDISVVSVETWKHQPNHPQ